jgi:transposase
LFAEGLFIADSAGLRIPHPEFYFSHIERLRRLSRSLSRKKPGSQNRRKARHTLAKFHEHIRRKRDYFLWHVARWYAANYRTVTIPKWPLKESIHYAVDSTTARKLCDSSYGRFVEMLRHKCNEFETELIERKDERWQNEKAKAGRVRELEQLQNVLTRSRKALRHRNPALLPWRKADLRPAATSRT